MHVAATFQLFVLLFFFRVTISVITMRTLTLLVLKVQRNSGYCVIISIFIYALDPQLLSEGAYVCDI